jgi:hypothetical protein
MKIKVTGCDDYRWWYADMVGNIIESEGDFLHWMGGIGLFVNKYKNVIKEGNYEIVDNTLIEPLVLEEHGLFKYKAATQVIDKINELVEEINELKNKIN